MRDLKNKLALVTGAGSGIGRAISLALAQRGCNLVLVDVDSQRLEKVDGEVQASGVKTYCYQCDLTSAEDVDKLADTVIEELKSIDILVNNAGIAHHGPTWNMTAQQWDRLMTINLLTPIQLVHRFLPILKELDSAHIVNISSMYGFTPGKKIAAYATSKFGLLGFSESLRFEFRRTGLGVTAVCPGFVKTNLFDATTSSNVNRGAPRPPNWLCTTADRVARRVVRGIRWNSRIVVITPLAHALYWVRHLCPPLLDWLHAIPVPGGRRRKSRNRK